MQLRQLSPCCLCLLHCARPASLPSTATPCPAACPPPGTFSTLPGAWEPAQCFTAEQRRQQQESQALSVQLLRWARAGGFQAEICCRHHTPLQVLLCISTAADTTAAPPHVPA